MAAFSAWVLGDGSDGGKSGGNNAPSSATRPIRINTDAAKPQPYLP